MSNVATIKALLVNAAGVTITTQGEARALNQLAVDLSVASLFIDPLRDQRPDILEQDLESARKEILSIIKRIEGLNKWALSVARRAATRDADERAISEAGTDVDAILAAVDRSIIPADTYPDIAAIKHLKALENGLKGPIETLIKRSEGLPTGKGAKPNLIARRVALQAGKALITLTGKPISYWRDSTAYATLTDELFRLFGINADTRRPCEWALSELARNT